MTGAVAGAAARAGGTRAAASSAARSSTRATGSTGRRPRARTVDERGQRAAERFGERWSKPGAATKRKPRPPSQRGLTDAISSGDVKTPERDGGGSGTAPATRDTRPAAPAFSFTVPGPVSSGAGVILAVIVWSWIGLPLLTGGPAAVKAQLMAKFLNRSPDGKWLP